MSAAATTTPITGHSSLHAPREVSDGDAALPTPPMAAAFPAKRLRDVAELRIGYQFRGKVMPAPDGPVRVIQIKDIDPDFQIRADDLARVKLERAEEYRVQNGDVLFLRHGHRLYAAEVREAGPNTIATGYFFILRPNGGMVHPAFLAWFLNQPEFQKSLRPFQQGSHIPMVSRSEMENLRIMLPPPDTQRQILQLNKLFDDEQRLTLAINEKRRALVEAVSRKLILGALSDKDN